MLLIVLAIVATNAVRPPQGMEFIGVGLDALTGEIKLPVVGFTHNDGRTWVSPYTSEVHDVADQTVIYAEAEADMGVAVHWSLQDYATAVAQQAGVGEEFLGGAFAKSEVVLEAHAVFAGGENVLAVTTSSYALYAIAAAPSELLAVTPSFSKMLDLLPEEYDAVAYKKLVKNFGSHVVVQGVFGGSATLYTTVSTGFYAAVGVQAVGQVALAQFRNLTAVGAIAGAEASTAVAASEGIVTSYMNFQGGLWEEVDQYSSWVKSIKVAPHRISYRVADISEFVQHPVKKANLKKAILEHVLPLKQQ
jgi:hypothetical protein